MQSGINGHETCKNVGVMHEAVFADGALEAKNAQVVGENQNFEGFKKRKIAIGTAKRAVSASKMITHALFEAVWGAKK